jgi:hypothetical protein
MSFVKGLIPGIVGLSLLMASCGSGETKEEAPVADTVAAQPVAIALADVPASPVYTDAQLSIGNVTATAQGADSVKLSFTFNVKNYELKSQTSDAANKMCNNSDKGQHIHFILDNKPYTALYEPKHEVVVPKGGEHYLLVFLSRSYHESVKSKGAADIMHFKIDDKGKLQKMEAPKTPMVFYSRPKGDYIGAKNTDNLLLDFYVWNCELSDSSYKVKAELKAEGIDTSFVFNSWTPHFLQHVPMGKPSVTLSLWDKDGKKLEGPNTEVTREFNLAADEPMK